MDEGKLGMVMIWSWMRPGYEMGTRWGLRERKKIK
jgi:hypothetical protein